MPIDLVSIDAATDQVVVALKALVTAKCQSVSNRPAGAADSLRDARYALRAALDVLEEGP